MSVPKKTCSKCGEEKSLTDFYWDKRCKDEHRSECKACALKSCKQYRRKNGDRCRKYGRRYQRDNEVKVHGKHLERRYGITAEDFNQRLTEQNGSCAICKIHWSKFKQRLAVHHDHETNEVLALLCCNCNTLLGQIEKAERTGLMVKMNAFRERYQ